MNTRTSFVIASLCTTLLAFGCSSDDGEKLLPCPEGGLKTAEQVENADKYNCKEAQVCPDQGSMPMPTLGWVIDPDAAPWTSNVILTNCSKGQTRLEITKIFVRGDARCSFSEPQLEKTTIDPGDSAVVNINWKPEAVGEDHAAVVIFSNAQNFPELILPVCSTAFAEAPTPTNDAGTIPALECDANKTQTVNTTCHTE